MLFGFRLRPLIFTTLILFCFKPAIFATTKTRVLLVTAESTGLFQTGGLAHAVHGLARAFNQEGLVADIAIPYYLRLPPPKDLRYPNTHIEVPLDVDSQGQAHRWTEFYLLKAGKANHGETLFFRHHSNKFNYFDNRVPENKKFYGPESTLGEGFGAFSKAVAQYVLTHKYDIVILNDWHTALTALFLEMARQQGHQTPKVILAIHNLAFQGNFPHSLLYHLGIPDSYFDANDGIEFYGNMSFLKAGILKSDLVYTVSPQYAQDIATSRFGAGMDGLIRRAHAENRLVGILNGIDDSSWDPVKPYHDSIQWTFSSSDFSGKAKGKAALQARWNLPVNASTPIYVLSSRVVEQKGYAYLPRAMESFLLRKDAQFIVIGDGEPQYIDRLKALELRFPHQFRYKHFKEDYEKEMKAYGDFFINAAWFEPSGLNQLFALKNGTIPILSQVGGLSNSVVDGVSGLFFPIHWKQDHSGYDVEATIKSLVQVLDESHHLFFHKPKQILKMRRAGMLIDNSWNSRVNNEFKNLFNERLSVSISQNRKCRTALRPSSPDEV